MRIAMMVLLHCGKIAFSQGRPVSKQDHEASAPDDVSCWVN